MQTMGLGHARLHFVEHHRAHLASAFFASPFEEAAVVSLDGFGDFSSAMWGVGQGNRIDVRGNVRFPHSLGIFYSAFTQLLGFPHYGDEYKMMGLAAFGEARFAPAIRNIVRVEGGQIRLNLDYFVHHAGGSEMSWDNGAPTIAPLIRSAWRMNLALLVRQAPISRRPYKWSSKRFASRFSGMCSARPE
jgi:carbamoyltransferase